MKIGIITFSDRNNMPYLKYYEDIIQKEKVNYECIFWDRFTNKKTEKINNEYTLHIKCLPGANKLGKIIPMLKYKYIVEKITLLTVLIPPTINASNYINNFTRSINQ